MKAKEAREITNQKLNENKAINTKYTEVMKWILWAANQGKSYTEFDKAVGDASPNLRLIIKYMLLAEDYQILPKSKLGAFYSEEDCIVW